jgi:hypothetical protein
MYYYDCFHICKVLTEGEINQSINGDQMCVECGKWGKNKKRVQLVGLSHVSKCVLKETGL